VDERRTLKLGTRGSLLARTQSRQVADAIEAAHPSLRVELVELRTTGDRVTDRPLHEIGGKGLFTRELELALLEGRVDLVVHSAKDVPVTEPLVETADLLIAAVPARADPRDALLSRHAGSIDDLPANATVGTTSLRRAAALRSVRDDLRVMPLRGNVDTRLAKLDAGEFDAIVLAMAGLERLGRLDRSFMHPLDPDRFVPAAGQGALAIQCRRADVQLIDTLRAVHDAASGWCVELERAVVRSLQGDCRSPIGAWASLESGTLVLTAMLGGAGGRPPVAYHRTRGAVGQIPRLADETAAALRSQIGPGG
jgi:hydroxymethylbilane synthase